MADINALTEFKHGVALLNNGYPELALVRLRRAFECERQNPIKSAASSGTCSSAVGCGAAASCPIALPNAPPVPGAKISQQRRRAGRSWTYSATTAAIGEVKRTASITSQEIEP
ncbi:MAG: hypothetical protein WBC04_03660 [Candidatus Acidiferrales bacterium]